jgi:hypothetical protein
MAAGAVVVAIGAGLGTYFALRGSDYPPVPTSQQSPILEQAKAEGVIAGYRIHAFNRWYGPRVYETGDGAVMFNSYSGRCGGHGPACLSRPPLIVLEYRHGSADVAQAIQHIAHELMPGAKIKTFEFTTPGG